MPKKAEAALKRTAEKRGYGKKRTGAYVYDTLRDMGWKPGHQSSYKNDEVDHSPQIIVHHDD